MSFLQIFDDIMTVKKGQKSSMVLDMNQCNAYSSLGYFTSSSSLLVQQSSSIIFFILLTLILLWIKIHSNHFLNLLCITLFKNYSKCRIWSFEFWHFPPIFVLLKLTCLVTLFDRKLRVFKNSPKWTIFGNFNWLLSTQNVNVACFARNVEWDFFCDFQIKHCERSELRLH